MKALNRTVILLGFVSLLNDLSSEMIMPVLPLFIASLGGTGFVIGLVGGIADSVSSLLKAYLGNLSDRIGKRKPLIISGYAISSLSKALYFFAAGWPMVLAFRVLDRVGKGVRTAPRDSLIADTTPPEYRGAAFGFHRAMDSMGAVLGTIVVLILFWQLRLGFREIFLVAGLIGFLALIPLFIVGDPPFRKQEKKVFAALKGLSPELRKFTFVSSLFYLGNFTYMFFILRAQQSLGKSLAESTVLVLLLYLLFNLVYTASAYFAGKLSDRVGRKKTISMAYLLFALTAAGFAFFNDFWHLVVFFVVYGLFNAFLEGNEKALAADLSASDARGTSMGAFHTAIGLMALPSSVIAGFLWDAVSPEASFLFGAFLALLALLLLNFWVKK